MTALDRVTAKLGAVRNGSARCPAHEDGTASLSVSQGRSGVLLYCHAGCLLENILAELNLTKSDLFDDEIKYTSRATKPGDFMHRVSDPLAREEPRKRIHTDEPKIVATYDYNDEQGNLLFQAVRMSPKSFRQRRTDGQGGWIWKLGDTRRILYRLPELRAALAANPNARIVIAEGEKDCLALVAAGRLATCCPMGAGKWSEDLTQQLVDAGAELVTIVADKDVPGYNHAKQVRDSLTNAGCKVSVVHAVEGKDAHDALVGHRLDIKVAFVRIDDELDGLASPQPKNKSNIKTESSSTSKEASSTEPTEFFAKGAGLLHATLRSAVLDSGPIVAGLGQTLWRYDSGVYLADGPAEVTRRVVALLDESYRPGYATGITGDLAAREPEVTDDPRTDVINVRNGLLYWHTGTLQPHTPEVITTCQLSVEWDATATCPNIDAFFASVVEPDVVPLLWEVIGLCLYSGMPFHRAVLLLGPGRNGKGTYLRIIEALVPRSFRSSVTLQRLAENRFAAAELFGKVANIAGDLDARAIGQTDVFKMVTGQDTVTAERKNGHPFQFVNRATMVFSANEAPGTADHTGGFYARWIVIPFTKLQIVPGREDHTIEDAMHTPEELRGALVQAVNGLRRALEQRSVTMPDSVKEATSEFVAATDPMRRYVEDRIEVADRTHREPRAAIYRDYRSWTNEQGGRPLGAQKFWIAFRALNLDIDDLKIRGERYVSGVRLLVDRWAP
jgi:putative DNA primase/helicase